MTLYEVYNLKVKISVSSADRERKTKLYELCEEREKELDRTSALVVQSYITQGESKNE